MERPKRPRIPTEPRKPKPLISGKNYCGQKYAYSSGITLANFIDEIMKTISRRMKLTPNEIRKELVLLHNLSTDFSLLKTVPDPNFEKKNKKYLEEKKKYRKKLKVYNEKLKQFEINNQLYEAWILKKESDEIKNKILREEKRLQEIEVSLKTLVNTEGCSVNEKTKKTNKT